MFSIKHNKKMIRLKSYSYHFFVMIRDINITGKCYEYEKMDLATPKLS